MTSAYFFPDTFGGVEFHIYHLSKALEKRGHEVTVVHPVLTSVNNNLRIDVGNYRGISILRVLIPSRLYSLGEKISRFSSDTQFGYMMSFLRKASYAFSAATAYQEMKGSFRQADIIHQHDFSSSFF